MRWVESGRAGRLNGPGPKGLIRIPIPHRSVPATTILRTRETFIAKQMDSADQFSNSFLTEERAAVMVIVHL